MLPLRIQTASFLLLTLLCLIILPGCWSAHEFNNEFILLAESIDTVGDQISVTSQLLSTEQSNGSGNSKSQNSTQAQPQAQFFLITGKGKSIAEAVSDYRSKAPRYIYGGHLEVLFISEDAAKAGIMPYLDFFTRHYWSLDSVWLVITHGPARDMLTLNNPMMKYVTIGLEEYVQKGERGIEITTLSDFLLNYHSDSGTQILTSSAIVYPKRSKMNDMEQLKISNTALFCRDRLISFLSPEEGAYYNYFVQDFRNTAFPIQTPPFFPQEKLTVNLNGKSPTIEAIPTEQGLTLSVKDTFDFEVTEDTSFVKADEKYISALEESVNENFSDQLRELIRHTQEEKSDVFNVADRLHTMHSELWNEVKANWPEEYSKLPLQIEINARYRHSRTMTSGQGYKEE
jgi:spore germination protein KC